MEENTLYRFRDPDSSQENIRLGSELKWGIELKVAAGKTQRRMVSPYRESWVVR